MKARLALQLIKLRSIELHSDRAYHVHMLLVTNRYFYADELTSLWHEGYASCRRVRGKEGTTKALYYVAKYATKPPMPLYRHIHKLRLLALSGYFTHFKQRFVKRPKWYLVSHRSINACTLPTIQVYGAHWEMVDSWCLARSALSSKALSEAPPLFSASAGSSMYMLRPLATRPLTY